MPNMEYELTEHGTVHIADEVVQIIAGVATSEVEGVASMSGSFAGGLTESITGRRNLSKGVKVQFTENDRACTIDIYVSLRFGVNIPDTSYQIQERVKASVENMTGLRVDRVNVHILAIAFGSEPDDKSADTDLIVSTEHNPVL